MAQSSVTCNLNNTIPISKPWSLNPNAYDSAKSPSLGFAPRSKIMGGVRAMAANDRRESLDHLQRPGVVKKREPQSPSVPVGLWDRFPAARTVQQMMDTMERMIDEPLAFTSAYPAAATPATNGGGYARGRTPWEIKETETDYKLRFDMPGMTKNDVKVWVEEKMLVIKAEKVPKKKEHQNGAAAVVEEEEEWPAKSFGKYSTRIALPENVEFEKIKAEVKDGVLYISIPKAAPTTKVFDINVQ